MKDTWYGIVRKFNKKYNTKGDESLKGTFTVSAVDYELRKIKEELVTRHSCARNLDLYKFADDVRDFELAFCVIYHGSKLKNNKQRGGEFITNVMNKKITGKLNKFTSKSSKNKEEGGKSENAVSDDETFEKADS